MRLSEETLPRLPAGVARPGYDRSRLATGIVHLGLGAFFRAHGAAATDAVLADDPRWGIAAANLRSPALRDALAPQDGLYTLAERSDDGERLRVVGAVREAIFAPAETERLLARMSDPAVRLVTLTVTEKGTCHDPATGELDEAHPDIRRDLADPQRPATAPGLIVEALRRRRTEGAPFFSVLSCDNLPDNGALTRRVLARYARLADGELGAAVAGELACPSTMVDRITPATTDADRARIGAALGMDDAAPVITEPFAQWVIEDRFAGPRFNLGRPDWDRVDWRQGGAAFVADVAPYETMKLRLLNGAHSTLAYLGALAGVETVADAMAEPSFAALADAVMEEAAPTLAMPAGEDVGDYRAALLARFRNGALRHRTRQICMDGSQKLPQRLLGTIRDRIARGLPCPALALGVAGWMRYVGGRDESGAAIDVRDPLAARLRDASAAAGPQATDRAAALAGIRTIFGPDLGRDPRFLEPVAAALASLEQIGARRTVEALFRA